MWYNSKTNELQSAQPWGSGYLAPAVIADLYGDWSQVADNYVPTVTLTTAEKIAALDAEYQSQFADLAQAYATALMAGDNTTASSVQMDYTALKTEYTTALAAIE